MILFIIGWILLGIAGLIRASFDHPVTGEDIVALIAGGPMTLVIAVYLIDVQPRVPALDFRVQFDRGKLKKKRGNYEIR